MKDRVSPDIVRMCERWGGDGRVRRGWGSDHNVTVWPCIHTRVIVNEGAVVWVG